MRILVIGSGGREHALCWSLKKSPKLTELFCAPGNAGIAELATCFPIAVDDFDRLADFALDEKIDLVVVGPDDPLAEGIVDHLESRGVNAFGPNQAAAQIEASKVFMKRLCRDHQIPTARYEVFDDADQALHYIHHQGAPIVLKADGLAAGKGAIVAHTVEEAVEAVDIIMRRRAFGPAGDRIVIEEFLQGQEVSILAFVDGETVRPMAEAQDHKPVFDGGKGPNTGGMGSYSPCPQIPREDIEEAIETIVKPAARAMVEEGRPFKGVLFAGLMMTDEGPRLIEFNARFGDPETQVLLPRLNTDLLEILLATVEGRLADIEIKWSDEAALCVILASDGYPTSYETGFQIHNLAESTALLFHAGTERIGDQIVTRGGRVLGVVATGPDIATARVEAYDQAEKIHFHGRHMRRDIGEWEAE